MTYIPPIGNAADLSFLGSYNVPTGDDAVLLFGEDVSAFLYQIWTDENFVYAATSVGLDIYDIVSENKYAYMTYAGGFNTVWANSEYVFVGTSDDGVKYIPKVCISGSIGSPYNIYTCLFDIVDLTPHYELTSDNIYYIHGSNNIVMAVTELGVDVVKFGPGGYRSSTVFTGTTRGYKGFMTSTGTFYYTISGSLGWELYRINTCLFDWSTPDYAYTSGSDVFTSLAGLPINDIFATEHTAVDGIGNTIFVATASGVYVIDESSLNYAIYYKE